MYLPLSPSSSASPTPSRSSSPWPYVPRQRRASLVPGGCATLGGSVSGSVCGGVASPSVPLSSSPSALPRTRPSQPSRTTHAWQPRRMALLATARTAAFMPALSPPDVMTAMRGAMAGVARE